MYVTKEQIADRKTMPQELWWKMCDYRMSEPVPLEKADLSKPFVYDRAFGVFYVGASHHQSVMALLFAWHRDHEDYLDLDVSGFGLREPCPIDLAERYLTMHVGTCFKSSVSQKVICGFLKNMNEKERDYFHPLVALKD